MEKTIGIIRILVITDSITSAELISNAIVRAGFNIIWERVETAAEMREALSNCDWDLILSDQKFHRLSTFEVLRVLKQAERDIPLAVFTGNINQDSASGNLMGDSRDNSSGASFAELFPAIHHELLEVRNRHEQGRLEAGLLQEKDLLAVTLKSIGDGVITTNIRGEVSFMNNIAEELTGWSLEEARNRRIDAVFIIGDQSTKTKMESPIFCAMEQGKTVGLKNNTVLFAKDGTERYISASSAPIRDPRNQIIGGVVVFRDITRIIAAQDLIATERANFKAIFDGAPVGMLILNQDTLVTQVNEEIINLFGKSIGNVLQQRFGDGFDCIHSTGTPGGCGSGEYCLTSCHLRLSVHSVLQTKEALRGVETLHAFIINGLRKDVWLRMSAVPIVIDQKTNVVVALDDITDIKRNEAVVQEQLHFLQELIDVIPNPVYYKNNTGVYELCNKAFLTFTGFDKEQIIGNTVHGLYSPDLAEFYERKDLELFNHPGTQIYETLFQRVLDKEEITVILNKATYCNTAGEVIGLVGMIQDISERKRAEEELTKAKEAAEAASKAKSEFLANMSHEIRTPLNGVVGMAELTLMTDLSEDQRENLMIAKNCADALLRVINDILDFSKIEAGKVTVEKKPFDIYEWFDKMMRSHQMAAQERNLTLKGQIHPAVPRVVEGDANRLAQVMNNLIHNAIKFTESGWVELNIKPITRTKTSVVLKFTVSDTGIGISAAEMECLFKSFSQVDGTITRKYGGTGLGLAISKQLVEMMGGQIGVNSDKGIGSTFHFVIPFKTDKGLDLPVESASPKNFEMVKPLRIMVVEDDRINQMATCKMLELRHYGIMLANNGREAVQKFTDNPVDLILMDIQMPELDGIEATRRIRAAESGREPHVPIIALTAHALQGDRERFLEAGMDGYVAKPVQVNTLFEEIDRVIGNGLREAICLAQPRMNGEPVSADEGDGKTISITKHRIGEALRNNQLHEVERLAHEIKYMAADQEFFSLKNVCFKMEMAARKGNVTELIELLDKMDEIITKLNK